MFWVADVYGNAAVGEIFGPRTCPYVAQRVVFTANVATIGSRLATQATQLARAPGTDATLAVTSYDSVLRPSPSFLLQGRFWCHYTLHLPFTRFLAPQYPVYFPMSSFPTPLFFHTDYYGQVNTSDNATAVTASVLPRYHCGGSDRVGYLSGANQVTAVNGRVTFDTISAYCYPGGNMTVPTPLVLSFILSFVVPRCLLVAPVVSLSPACSCTLLRPLLPPLL